MTASLIFFLAWAAIANLLAMIPSKDNLWTRAYILMALGVPLLIWVAWENHWITTLICLAAAASVLRWPMIYAWRWVKRRGGKAE